MFWLILFCLSLIYSTSAAIVYDDQVNEINWGNDYEITVPIVPYPTSSLSIDIDRDGINEIILSGPMGTCSTTPNKFNLIYKLVNNRYTDRTEQFSSELANSPYYYREIVEMPNYQTGGSDIFYAQGSMISFTFTIVYNSYMIYNQDNSTYQYLNNTVNPYPYELFIFTERIWPIPNTHDDNYLRQVIFSEDNIYRLAKQYYNHTFVLDPSLGGDYRTCYNGYFYGNPIFIDYNNDGLMDYISTPICNVSLFINLGNNTYSKQNGSIFQFLVSSISRDILSLDINNDSYTDLVSPGIFEMAVYLNRGNYSFTKIPIQSPSSIGYAQAMSYDINEDGLLDLILSSKYGYPNNDFGVYLAENNYVNFTIATIDTYTYNQFEYPSVVIANGISLPSIFIVGVNTISTGTIGSFSILSWLGGTDLFDRSSQLIDQSSRVTFMSGSNSYGKVLDFDNDGCLDMFLRGLPSKPGNSYQNNIFLGDCKGILFPTTLVFGGIYGATVWEDFNLDGYPDYFTSLATDFTRSDNTISMTINKGFSFTILLANSVFLPNPYNSTIFPCTTYTTLPLHINNDTLPDLAIITPCITTNINDTINLDLFINLGNGSFAMVARPSKTILTGHFIIKTSTQIIPMPRLDGYDDIIITTPDISNYQIIISDGSFTSTMAQLVNMKNNSYHLINITTPSGFNYNPRGAGLIGLVFVSDIDLDGYYDIIVTAVAFNETFIYKGTNQVGYYLSYSFRDYTDVPYGFNYEYLSGIFVQHIVGTILDFNLDGYPDILFYSSKCINSDCTSKETNKYYLLINNGNGFNLDTQILDNYTYLSDSSNIVLAAHFNNQSSYSSIYINGARDDGCGTILLQERITNVTTNSTSTSSTGLINIINPESSSNSDISNLAIILPTILGSSLLLLLCLGCIVLLIICIFLCVIVVIVLAITVLLLMVTIIGTGGVALGVGSSSLIAFKQINTTSKETYQIDPKISDYSELQTHIEETTDVRTIPFKDLSLGKKIGQGAYGSVFIGEWCGVKVAIKTLHQLSPDALEEFRHEALMMAKVSHHPNIITLIGMVLEPNHLGLITHFCSGGSLDSYLTKHTLTEIEQLNVILGCASGLAFLHQTGIVHRDIAARNVLIGNSLEQVYLSDFGYSRLFDRNQDHQATNNTVGPIRWMAPESIRHRNYSPKSDVYSFGMLMYEITHLGKVPFHHIKSLPDVAIAVITQQATPTIDSIVSAELTNLMRQCWNFNSEDRPTMEQVYNELSGIKIEITSCNDEIVSTNGSNKETNSSNYQSFNSM